MPPSLLFLQPPGDAGEHLSQVTSLSCSEFSMAPTPFGVKAKAIPIVHELLHHLPHHHPALLSSFSTGSSHPAMVPSLLFTPARHGPASGTLHLLSHDLESPSSQLSPSPGSSLLSSHILNEVHPDYPSCNLPPTHPDPFTQFQRLFPIALPTSLTYLYLFFVFIVRPSPHSN